MYQMHRIFVDSTSSAVFVQILCRFTSRFDDGDVEQLPTEEGHHGLGVVVGMWWPSSFFSLSSFLGCGFELREVRGGPFGEDALAGAADPRGAIDHRAGERVRAVGGCPPERPVR